MCPVYLIMQKLTFTSKRFHFLLHLFVFLAQFIIGIQGLLCFVSLEVQLVLVSSLTILQMLSSILQLLFNLSHYRIMLSSIMLQLLILVFKVLILLFVPTIWLFQRLITTLQAICRVFHLFILEIIFGSVGGNIFIVTFELSKPLL